MELICKGRVTYSLNSFSNMFSYFYSFINVANKTALWLTSRCPSSLWASALQRPPWVSWQILPQHTDCHRGRLERSSFSPEGTPGSLTT